MTYEATVEEITAVDGVEVDVTVRGDEDKAEKVLMDIKERIGVLGYCFEVETPPSEVEDVPDDYRPLMTPAWDRIFDGGGE